MGVKCHLSFLVNQELSQYTVSNSVICGYFCLWQNTILFTYRFIKICTVFSSGKGRDFSCLLHLHIASGAYPAFCTVVMLSLLVKQQLGYEVDQLPPSVASISVCGSVCSLFCISSWHGAWLGTGIKYSFYTESFLHCWTMCCTADNIIVT
jgi:hypothetical protein